MMKLWTFVKINARNSYLNDHIDFVLLIFIKCVYFCDSDYFTGMMLTCVESIDGSIGESTGHIFHCRY